MAKVAWKLSLSQSPTAWMQPRTWMVPSSSRRWERGERIPNSRWIPRNRGFPASFVRKNLGLGIFLAQGERFSFSHFQRKFQS